MVFSGRLRGNGIVHCNMHGQNEAQIIRTNRAQVQAQNVTTTINLAAHNTNYLIKSNT
jgi:hypothetical protein